MPPTTPKNCASFREDFLVAQDSISGAPGVSGGDHLSLCTPCEEWRERTLLVTGVLHSLDRLVAPEDLDERLVEDIELDLGACLGPLRNLERQLAPDELLALVAADLEVVTGEERPPKWLPLLEELPKHKAPRVLDRLVSEELQDCEKAITKRVVGGLFRRRTPHLLEARLRSELAGTKNKSNGFSKRTLSLGSAAAAALVIWIAAPGFYVVATPKLRFEVVAVANIHELSPLAQSLASGFLVGMLDPMESGSYRSNVKTGSDEGSAETDGGSR
ncbi:MAG: hypothetical protein ACI89E_001914 [Planctomycetota bacterium]|jgi:hypothetical protein